MLPDSSSLGHRRRPQMPPPLFIRWLRTCSETSISTRPGYCPCVVILAKTPCRNTNHIIILWYRTVYVLMAALWMEFPPQSRSIVWRFRWVHWIPDINHFSFSCTWPNYVLFPLTTSPFSIQTFPRLYILILRCSYPFRGPPCFPSRQLGQRPRRNNPRYFLCGWIALSTVQTRARRRQGTGFEVPWRR